MKKNMSVLASFLLVGVAMAATLPSVSSETYSKGIATITQELLGAVDHVVVSYEGASLEASFDVTYSNRWLRRHGYIRQGQYTELTRAISRIPVRLAVAPVNDSYELRVTVRYLTSQGQLVMFGLGQAEIQARRKGVLVSRISVLNRIPGTVNVDGKPRSTVTLWQDLPEEGQFGAGNTDTLPSITANDGNYRQVRTCLQVDLADGDVVSIKNLNKFQVPSLPFFPSDKGVVGGFPLVDFTTGHPVNRVISVNVPVYGYSEPLAASRIFLKPVRVGSKTTDSEGNSFPEIELPPGGVNPGEFLLRIPSGGYQLRVEFPQPRVETRYYRSALIPPDSQQ